MFLHPYLLAGLLACGVPVLLHLLMRQKPKPLVFPAFRFLLQRRTTNQSRMRLRNVLLMLLRVLVLAALVLALAQPRLFGGAAGTLAGKDARVILLIDTSPSMEYGVAGVSRLDEAVSRARELLAAIGADSRAAVLDSGDLIDEKFGTLAEARDRLGRLRIRPGAGSLNRAAERGIDLLAKERRPDGPALAMYIFTDRTEAAWDKRGTTPKRPEDVAVRVVDVGAETPRDLGIESVEVVPPAVVPGGAYQVRVKLRGTPTGHNTHVSCKLDSEADDKTGRMTVEMAKGQDTDSVVFERRAPSERPPADMPLGLRVWVGTSDNMAFNNARHATLVVRGGRKMLCLTTAGGNPGVWPKAIRFQGAFAFEVRNFTEASAFDLSEYAAVAVCQPEEVPPGWWAKLAAYVTNGGAVAVIPGGDEVKIGNFNDGEAILPAKLDRLEDAPKEGTAPWDRFSAAHPLTAPFVKHIREGADFGRRDYWPFVRRYWRLGPLEKDASVIATYAAPGGPAALAERRVAKGRVVLFTTPLDLRKTGDLQWTNYWEGGASFGFVLIGEASKYLAGEDAAPRTAFPCGQEVSLRLPSPLVPPYSLDGPGLGAAERRVGTPPAGGDASIPQARQPGNYTVKDGKGRAVAGFSLDVPSREGDLRRIEKEALEAIFGDKCVAQPGAGSLKAALTGGRAAPFELLPWLMMGLLAFMAGEGLLANRYYSTPPEGEEKP